MDYNVLDYNGFDYTIVDYDGLEYTLMLIMDSTIIPPSIISEANLGLINEYLVRGGDSRFVIMIIIDTIIVLLLLLLLLLLSLLSLSSLLYEQQRVVFLNL